MNRTRTLVAGAMLTCSLALGAVAAFAEDHPIRFVAKLAGASEVPAVASTGRGTVRATLNASHTTLEWRVEYNRLSGDVIAAHIHGPAAVGENAGPVIPLTTDLKSPITGAANVTPAQVLDLLAGKWYLNLHTAAHPAGEVRGQLMQEQK